MKYHNTLKQAEKSAKDSGNNYSKTEWTCKCGQIRDAYVELDENNKCVAHVVCRKCNPVKLGGKRKNCGRPKVEDKKEQTPIYIKRSRMELLGRKLVRKISSDAVEVEYQKRVKKQVLDLFAVSGAKRKVCPVCKKTFEKGWGEFCSQDCFLAFFLKK